MTTNTATEIGWLRGPGFDGFFIVGIAAIAVATGLVVTWNNNLFLPILAADLPLLAVVALHTSKRRHLQGLLPGNRAISS